LKKGGGVAQGVGTEFKFQYQRGWENEMHYLLLFLFFFSCFCFFRNKTDILLLLTFWSKRDKNVNNIP
jgi:hypothetical protein